MVWGRSAAPIGRFDAAAETAPAIATAQCASCETATVLQVADGEPQLPQGWIVLPDPALPTGASALCPDCSRPLTRLPDPVPPPLTAEITSVPQDAARGGQHGCRVLHQLLGGAAVIRIHAGARPVEGLRDDPVHFLLRATDLDELIEHLGTIRADLNREKVNG